MSNEGNKVYVFARNGILEGVRANSKNLEVEYINTLEQREDKEEMEQYVNELLSNKELYDIDSYSVDFLGEEISEIPNTADEVVDEHDRGAIRVLVDVDYMDKVIARLSKRDYINAKLELNPKEIRHIQEGKKSFSYKLSTETEDVLEMKKNYIKGSVSMETVISFFSKYFNMVVPVIE